MSHRACPAVNFARHLPLCHLVLGVELVTAMAHPCLAGLNFDPHHRARHLSPHRFTRFTPVRSFFQFVRHRLSSSDRRRLRRPRRAWQKNMRLSRALALRIVDFDFDNL